MQLHSLPLQCWNKRAISRIASKLGKPLCLDNTTQERRRISYARVLIEIDTSSKPIEEFEVKLPSGTTYTQYVSYENLPKFCTHCFIFGHYLDNCKLCSKAHVEKDSTHANAEGDVEKTKENPNNLGSNLTKDNGLVEERFESPNPAGIYVELYGPLNVNEMLPPLNDQVDTSVACPSQESTDNQMGHSHIQMMPKDNSCNAPEQDKSLMDDSDNSDESGNPLDEEGFQTVTNMRNKGKNTLTAINPKSNFKDGLSKFTPARSVVKTTLEKAKSKVKGGGGAPQSSSLGAK